LNIPIGLDFILPTALGSFPGGDAFRESVNIGGIRAGTIPKIVDAVPDRIPGGVVTHGRGGGGIGASVVGAGFGHEPCGVGRIDIGVIGIIYPVKNVGPIMGIVGFPTTVPGGFHVAGIIGGLVGVPRINPAVASDFRVVNVGGLVLESLQIVN
jgi:hypothetical protein